MFGTTEIPCFVNSVKKDVGDVVSYHCYTVNIYDKSIYCHGTR